MCIVFAGWLLPRNCFHRWSSADADAGRGRFCRFGPDHAELSNERNVQTLHGRAGIVHVPARRTRPRTHT